MVLVGIAGTFYDILLAPATLKSYVLGLEDLRDRVTVDIVHHKFMLPRNVASEADALAEQIAALSPDLVGFSTYCWNIDAVKRIAGRLRVSCPDTKILLGGPELDRADMGRGAYDAEPYDFLVFGEGECAFAGLLRALLDPDQLDAGKVVRLAFRSDQGFVLTPSGGAVDGLVPDLRSIPSPFLTGTIPDEHFARPKSCVNVETQRGCNLRCAYCLYHANFPKIRYRDPHVVLDELAYVHARGAKSFRITDANFFSDHAFATTVLQGLVERRFHMSLFIEVIPVFVDEAVADLLAQYRAISPATNRVLVGLGLQTINEASLRAINRHIPVKHFDRAFAVLAKAGAVIKSDIILGLPFETKASYLQLMEYISEKMRYGYNYLSLALLRLLPGTELKEIGERHELKVDRRDSDHFVYSTKHMTREEMILCARISGVAFRLFHASDDPERMKLRDFYFETKDRVGLTHVEMLFRLMDVFLDRLAGSAADYVQPDYPNAEHYWYYDIHKDIPEELVVSALERMRGEARRAG